MCDQPAEGKSPSPSEILQAKKEKKNSSSSSRRINAPNVAQSIPSTGGSNFSVGEEPPFDRNEKPVVTVTTTTKTVTKEELVITAEDEDTSPQEPHVFSVSELNKGIKSLLEGQFSLIWVRGEISNFKAHTSGHFYFSLKDKKAQISAVMFRGFNGKLRFRPEDGMEVLVRGRVTVYEPRGNYQIFCEIMDPVGAGALQMAFEQLKSKLKAEGLFEASRKRPLPILPRHIALVTSPTGAAVRDMLNVLGRRFKGVRITVVPCMVQGTAAPASIVQAIETTNLLQDVDVMIVGRGGGSIEDLWGFNDESVARAIVGSRVPVISAVGHEVDFTIADFVADLRAPTPSAAAELVIKNAADLQERLLSDTRHLRNTIGYLLRSHRQCIDGLNKRLVDPRRKLQDLILRCDELSMRLDQGMVRLIANWRHQLRHLRAKLGSPTERLLRTKNHYQYLLKQLQRCMFSNIERQQAKLQRQMSMLDSLSPLKVVERGYSIASMADGSGKIIKNAETLKVGSKIAVKFAKGSAVAEVLKIESEANHKGEKDGV